VEDVGHYLEELLLLLDEGRGVENGVRDVRAE
jgi:hypothetical protein